MIVEQRVYRVKLGKIPDFLKAVETIGLPVMRQTLRGLIGYFVTEVGPLNEVVHLWAYESMEDRARRREACAAHPDWERFLSTVRPLFEHMETRVMTPAPFTPITLDQIRALNRGAA